MSNGTQTNHIHWCTFWCVNLSRKYVTIFKLQTNEFSVGVGVDAYSTLYEASQKTTVEIFAMKVRCQYKVLTTQVMENVHWCRSWFIIHVNTKWLVKQQQVLTIYGDKKLSLNVEFRFYKPFLSSSSCCFFIPSFLRTFPNGDFCAQLGLLILLHR